VHSFQDLTLQCMPLRTETKPSECVGNNEYQEHTSSNRSGSATISMPWEPCPFLKTSTRRLDCSNKFL
jgi:hypothetical protein